jgi:hypothetical protein
MANHASLTTGESYSGIKRVSWGAIFAGTVVALVVQIVLTLLGLSIGLGVVSQSPTTGTLGGIGIGAGVWLVVSTLVSLFIGGYVASRLAGSPTRQDGAWHGVVVWAFATLLSVYLATSAVGTAVSGISGLLGQGLQIATRGVTSVAPEAAEAVKKNPQDTRQLARQAAQEAQQTLRQAKREAAQALNQAQQQAAQTTKQVAPAAAGTALGGFIALVLGAIAAALGGASGTPKENLAMATRP